MRQLKVLLVGSVPKLEKRLRQAGYHVDVETVPDIASERLRNEWFHLSIVHLEQTENEVDTERLALALYTDGLVPKIILNSRPLSQMNQVIRQVLTGLGQPAPAVAFLSEAEGMDVVSQVVETAVERAVKINNQLEISPGLDVFYTLANWIIPESDPGRWIEELEDLFRILFWGCTRIDIAFPESLRGRRGEIATVRVQPRSDAIPLEHPLLVKCGMRKRVEKARDSLEKYLLRVTPVREAGFARTRHFAALALSALADRPARVSDFPTFYRGKMATGAESDIYHAIDRLFDNAWKPWYRQTAPPSAAFRGRDLRSFYLTRLGLSDKKSNMKLKEEVIKWAPSYGAIIEQIGQEIGFRFSPRGRPDFYPDPILHLHGDVKSVKVFGMTPSQLRLTHNDLRGTNFCVDDQMVVWLDGYENVEWGPAVANVAGLEAILKFHCMDSLNLHELYQFERTVLSTTHFDEFNDISHWPPDMQQALRAIAHLRRHWARRIAGADLEEYYANLFFFTVRELVAEEVPSVYRHQPEIRKLHALLSAAMICYKLKNWSTWTGWPGPKHVLPLGGKV